MTRTATLYSGEQVQYCLSMIFPENRFTLFRIKLYGRWSRCERSSSIEAKRIMPSGICASIEPSE